MHGYNHSTWGAEAGGSRVQGQSGIHKTVSRAKKAQKLELIEIVALGKVGLDKNKGLLAL